MIITKNVPFSKEDIKKLRGVYDVYIKTVIDLEKKVCSAGCEMHFESEEVLLGEGSKQSAVWGGGVDLETKSVLFNSFINIRPAVGNTSNEIQDPEIRDEYEKLTRYFFKEIFKTTK